jgi:hypothetical protein
MPNYGNLTNGAAPNKKGGYKNALYFSEASDITTWQRPTAAGSVLGDTLAIAVAHTWASGKAVNTWETKIGTVQHTFETVGDAGAKEVIYVVRAEILGDSAAIQEQLNRLLNDNTVFWLKDSDCLVANAYYQFGDDCNPVSASINFDSKTNNPEQSNGQKSTILELRTKAKFYYTAALDFTP